MAVTTKVMLNKIHRKNDGTFPLVIRVINNRKMIYIPLGYTLSEKEFDAKGQRVKSAGRFGENVNRMNNIIAGKVKEVYEVFTDLEEEGTIKRLPIREIKKRILGIRSEADPITVIDFIDELIGDMKTAKRYGNAAIYKNLKNKLVKFTRNKPLYFEDINYRFLKKLETDHYAGRGDVGGLSVYMRTLRAIYNKAILAGVISKDYYPFENYKIRNHKPVRKALSEDDFTIFKDYSPVKGSYEYLAKQLFMASFYLRGMNWMDLAYLKVSDIQGDFDRITYVRKKTGEPFNIKIVPALKEIMLEFLGEKYEPESYVFPIINAGRSKNEILIIRNKRQKINKYLNTIAESLGIKHFSFYAARHTYATMGKRRGVPTAVIQESLGHKTEAITQTYLDSFENKVVDEYDELIMKD